MKVAKIIVLNLICVSLVLPLMGSNWTMDSPTSQQNYKKTSDIAGAGTAPSSGTGFTFEFRKNQIIYQSTLGTSTGQEPNATWSAEISPPEEWPLGEGWIRLAPASEGTSDNIDRQVQIVE